MSKLTTTKAAKRSRWAAMGVALLANGGWLVKQAADHTTAAGIDAIVHKSPSAQECVSTAVAVWAAVARADKPVSPVSQGVPFAGGTQYEQECGRRLHCVYDLASLSRGSLPCVRP